MCLLVVVSNNTLRVSFAPSSQPVSGLIQGNQKKNQYCRSDPVAYSLCQLLRHRGKRLALIQRALVSPPALVQRKGRPGEREEQEQVIER